MTRDMDLIRAILLRTEELPAGGGGEHAFAAEGRNPQEIWYHVRLASNAGLLEAKFLPRSTYFHVNGLTWEGHEFLEKSRNKSLWERAKENARGATGGLSIEVLTAVLTKLAVHAATGGR
jgi:hypothetical protein